MKSRVTYKKRIDITKEIYHRTLFNKDIQPPRHCLWQIAPGSDVPHGSLVCRGEISRVGETRCDAMR